MPKFLVEASYTTEGYKGLIKDKASGRKTAINNAAKKLGGKIEAIYYSMGENDVIFVVDMPDHVSMAALSAAAATAGTARTKTTLLLSVDEMDKALGTSVAYRAPGK